MHKYILHFAFKGILLGLVYGYGAANDTGGAGSEDCLYVNIYAPKGVTNTSALPVLAYIHGGGYFAGNPRSWPFDNWVQRSPTPFVAVTIYYRLSILGFLSAPEEPGKGVYSGKDPELILNAGIHDQRLALKFIQRHIRSFGGDPNKVTIMGQSAGAGSVGLHLTARSANPADRLFNRAVVQSWYRSPFSRPAARKEQWQAVANSVGCSTDSSTVAHTLECLRKINPVRLMQASDDGRRQAQRNTGSLWAWLPVIDNTLFKSNPASILNAIPGVDVIVGHTTADSASGGTPFEAVVNATFPGLTAADIQTLKAMYVAAGITDANMATFGLGEAVFRCGTHFLANLYGSRAHTYRWDEPDPGNPTSAGHSSDNYILYEGSRTLSNGTGEFHALTPAQRGLSDEAIAYFTSFYATAEPKIANTSSASHPVWPSHPSGKRIVFRAEGGGTGATQGKPGASYIEELDQAEVKRCKVWNSMVNRAGM
ncbi:Acetylcholinesterase [Rhizoctonia solani]|uniref:Carboxylic ester hydrolase n=1 Tax=Rhizoctonia solani TaxID=456999 RepID=A0A0K6G0U4_9AGAM|nr:Acetylcholinesterase [Rhizoctonia solani]